MPWYTIDMRNYIRTIIAFASILSIGIVGILVGNHLDWFDSASVQKAETSCFDKHC